MDHLCTQFWPCYTLPPEFYWAILIVMPLLMVVVAGIPIANILHRAGRSRWWMSLAFIPFVTLIGLWVFAFTRWPKLAT